MSVKSKLAEGMGYEYVSFHQHARIAIRKYAVLHDVKAAFLPSNICPALANAFGNAAVFLPVGEETGLAFSTNILVQLYGARTEYMGPFDLEIDPYLTRWKQQLRYGNSAIASFGYDKTIDLGGGGAFFTNDPVEAKAMDSGLYLHGIEKAIDDLDRNIAHRKERWNLWRQTLPFRFPNWTPTVPWRVICLSENRDEIVQRLRAKGIRVGTNYPPLPGCTDPSSVKWGKEVLNFWLDDDPKKIIEAMQ